MSILDTVRELKTKKSLEEIKLQGERSEYLKRKERALSSARKEVFEALEELSPLGFSHGLSGMDNYTVAFKGQFFASIEIEYGNQTIGDGYPTEGIGYVIRNVNNGFSKTTFRPIKFLTFEFFEKELAKLVEPLV